MLKADTGKHLHNMEEKNLTQLGIKGRTNKHSQNRLHKNKLWHINKSNAINYLTQNIKN